MKALRYLLIVMSLVSVLSISAQTLARLPESQMQSTSVMMSSGSTLPQAAVNGTYITGENPGTYTTTNPGRPRRVGENDGFEDEEDPENPGEPFPIGDAGWPLALCACAYLIWRATRKRVKPLNG